MNNMFMNTQSADFFAFLNNNCMNGIPNNSYTTPMVNGHQQVLLDLVSNLQSNIDMNYQNVNFYLNLLMEIKQGSQNQNMMIPNRNQNHFANNINLAKVEKVKTVHADTSVSSIINQFNFLNDMNFNVKNDDKMNASTTDGFSKN